jgi:ribonuclease HI
VRTLPQDPGLLIVSCDGASRGNPGPAGIGVHITDERGAVVAEIAEGLGETTNNVAEYTAAREGLRRAAELGATRVQLRSDSQLLIEQLSGRYKVKAAHLRPLYDEVVAEMARFQRVGLEHIPRERNREADRLANEGVDDWLRRRPR